MSMLLPAWYSFQPQLSLIWLQQGNAKSWKRATSRPRERDLPRHPKCGFLMGFWCHLYCFSVPKKKVEKSTAKKQSQFIGKMTRHHMTMVHGLQIAYLHCSHCCDHQDVPRHQRWSSCEARTWVNLLQAAGAESYGLGCL